MSKTIQNKTSDSAKGSRKRKRDLQPREDPNEKAPSSPSQQLIRWKKCDEEWIAEMGLEMLDDSSTDSSYHTAAAKAASKKNMNLLHAKNDIAPRKESPAANRKCALSTGDGDFVIFHRARNLDPVDNFSKISDEMMLQIFKWLPKPVLVRCAQVCKRWKRLALDETLWKRVDVGGKFIKAGIIGQLVKRGATILRMAQTNVEAPLFMDFTGITNERTSPLQYLDLSMAGISITSLNELLSVCSHLKKLSLECCTVNDETCRHIGENPSLDCLNMCLSEGLTTTGISLVMSGCLKLKSLNVSWSHLKTEAISHLCAHLPPDIENLNIAGFRNELTDIVVTELSERCRHLKELDLSDSALLTAKSLQAIVENLDALEHLSLSRCYAIAANQYLSLEMCFSLRNLEIYGLLSDASLESLKEKLSNLEINTHPFSSVARPTTGIRRTSIWGFRVRD